MEDKKEKPVLDFTEIQDFKVQGKTICTLEYTQYTNKDYFKLVVVFPDGSYKEAYIGYSRLVEKTGPR